MTDEERVGTVRYQIGLKLIHLHECYRDDNPDYDFLIYQILSIKGIEIISDNQGFPLDFLFPTTIRKQAEILKRDGFRRVIKEE